MTGTTEVDRRRAAVLLPLASGLAVAALAALTASWAVLVVHVAVLLAAGAVVAERPLRTAALVEAPSLAFGLGAAVGRSWLTFALFVAIALLALAISYFVVKTGAALGQEWQERRAAPPEPAAGPQSRPGIFATKARRGAFLIAVVVILSVAFEALDTWSSNSADRIARERAAEIQDALAGRTPEALEARMLTRAYTGEGEPIVGGGYRSAGLEGEDFVVIVEVRSGVERRCIRGWVGPDAVAHSEIRKGGC